VTDWRLPGRFASVRASTQEAVHSWHGTDARQRGHQEMLKSERCSPDSHWRAQHTVQDRQHRDADVPLANSLSRATGSRAMHRGGEPFAVDGELGQLMRARSWGCHLKIPESAWREAQPPEPDGLLSHALLQCVSDHEAG